MMILSGRNVNETFRDGLRLLNRHGVLEQTRNGPVKTIPEPVIMEHWCPTERVLFCRERKENPVFHILEALWMMAGRQDSDWLAQFNPRMGEFAELGGLIHGAYGYRWRKAFDMDQIREAVRMLLKDPLSRRVVIQMWDAKLDLNQNKKDLPCNTHIYFRTIGHRLDMTVCNRSNDFVWGALGSNVVHFSVLHELVSHAARLSVGRMNQFTNNLHIYERHWPMVDRVPNTQSYSELCVHPYPMIKGDLDRWLIECTDFVAGKRSGFSEPFFQRVAVPIIERRVDDIEAKDWKLACERYWNRIGSIV